jgi:hypothetical protein
MRSAPLACLVLTSIVAQSLLAQSDEPKMPSTLAEGLLARFDEATSKMLQLAEAIPADNTPGARRPRSAPSARRWSMWEWGTTTRWTSRG